MKKRMMLLLCLLALGASVTTTTVVVHADCSINQPQCYFTWPQGYAGGNDCSPRGICAR